MTGQPLTPQDNDPDLTEVLDVKPKNAFFSNLNGKFKSNKVPKVAKPVMPNPTLDKTVAAKVPLNRRPKRAMKEPGQTPREVKPGLKIATTAQQRKLIPMVGVFLLLGAVSLYVNFSNTRTEKPITAFVMPGPGQPGYIPAPGTMSAGVTGNTAAGAPPSPSAGSASAGYMPGTPGAPVVTGSAATSTSASTGASAITVSTTPPPVRTTGSTKPGTATTATGQPGSAAGSTTGHKTPPATGKPGAATAGVPGAPGSKPAAAPTDVPTEPVIPDVFSAADAGKNGATSGAGATGSGTTVRNAPVVNAAAQPAALRNVPIAAVPQQVQIAQAAPLSIRSLPAPTPTPVRAVPTLSAVPVALPTPVRVQPLPQVAQSMPLPAPVTAQTPSGVTLTRGGVVTTATPAAPAPSVVLVGTASGDTPTAILATPDGQMIAGIGDHVTVNSLDYTVSKINATSVTMTHLKDTLTLTETN